MRMVGDGDVTIGVDLGGTKVEVGLVDQHGRVLGGGRRPTGPERGPDGVLSDLVACIAEDLPATGERAVLAVGVGVAGQVEPETGTVLRAPNLEWRDFPLKARLEESIDLPVFVINDVQAATYGEWTCGAGQGSTDIVCLFVGTGVGGGVVSDGSLVRGCGGSAGELGHMIIERHGPECTCGNRGCLEALAAGWAIARRARDATGKEPDEGRMLIDLAGGRAENLTAEVVAEAARQGDPLAMRLVRETGEALGVGVASIANTFNPCKVIMGGGVLEGMPELLELAEAEARRRALEAALRSLEVVKAGLGKHSGTVGAAMWARKSLTAAGIDPYR